MSSFPPSLILSEHESSTESKRNIQNIQTKQTKLHHSFLLSVIRNEYRSFSYGQINVVARNVVTGASPAYVGPLKLLTTAYNCDDNLEKVYE